MGLLPERNSIGQPNIELLIQSGLPIIPGPDGGAGLQHIRNDKAAANPGACIGIGA